MKYFYINNQKFNYDLEFDTKSENNKWKTNAPLIEFCETLGITIPHYCYHKKLSIAGNCRMCLIEIKKSPKPVVSCAMGAKSSLNANTEMYTNSPLVKKARENIMEFLLLNHPLDCPICDQGGECDLQDQSLFFGFTKKRFYNFKRVVSDKNIGPIVKTVMTRCIHCTRCVRFATEIAGVEDLGVFGRGVNSEIGTYVEKIFQSELSGNVIDICPVGALTSKPYPFLGRSWELKSINSIDVSDGFGENIQAMIKSNRIVKILPDYNSNSVTNNWISDKTRFMFEGMFSPNRRLENLVVTGKDNSFELNSWENILEEITYILYFQDHLNSHFFEVNDLIIIFEETINLELLNLLLILKNNYSFLKLRRLENFNCNNDLGTDFQLNSISNKNKLDYSEICLLIGVDTRYESSQLNLKLRQRYLKGNFKIFSLFSFSDLTYPVKLLGSNLKLLKDIAEGNHPICKVFKSTKKLSVIVGSETFKRSDARIIFKLLQLLEKNTKTSVEGYSIINVINSSLNSAGINALGSFKTLSDKDFKKYSGIYFINSCLNNQNINKLINLKLLNYLTTNVNFNKIIVEQNNVDNYNSAKIINGFGVSNYTYLPNNVFFETSGSYVNTEGLIKKTVKLLTSMKNTKDDWQILRKLFFYFKKVNFINNSRQNSLISFNCNNLHNFKNYISFNTLPTKNLSNISFLNITNINQTTVIPVCNFFASKSKIRKTKLKKWLEDFYIGGSDCYSKHSSTMVSCSNNLRMLNSNFYQNI